MKTKSNNYSGFCHHHNRTKQPPPLLDLHGKQRSEAIRAVTNFLELHHHKNYGRQVCIVTGTGSHSQRGPVLRNAVQELLTKRQMDFQRNSPGSFLVRAGTGIVWTHQASTEQDTKLIVQDTREGDNFSIQTAVNRSKAVAASKRQPTGADVPPGLPNGPSPTEVAVHEAACERARQESLDISRRERKEQGREQRQLELALTESRAQQEREEEQDHSEEEDLQWALRESELCAAAAAAVATESSESRKEQEESLEEALRRSLAVPPERQDDGDWEREMEEAYDLSLRSYEEQEESRSAMEEEDERIIQEVLALSMKTHGC